MESLKVWPEVAQYMTLKIKKKIFSRGHVQEKIGKKQQKTCF